MARTTIKKRLKRILRSPQSLFVTGILTVLAATLLFANKGIVRNVELHRQISGQHAQLAKLTTDEQNLTRAVNLLKLDDASTVERIARERYGMKRPGEIIYTSSHP